jgi:hypothetical protein
MESEPNRYADFLKRQREQTLPPHMAERLERKVMERLLRSQPDRRRARLRWATVSLTVSAIMIFSLLVLRHPSGIPLSTKPLAFEESVVILDDDLVCIWLEPLGNSSRETAP